MKTLSLTILLCPILSFPANSQWVEQTSPTTKPLYSVSVVDNYVAWACGRAGTIIRTSNGGADWIIISPGYFQDYLLVLTLKLDEVCRRIRGSLRYPKTFQFGL